jgi:hypothetical protein
MTFMSMVISSSWRDIHINLDPCEIGIRPKRRHISDKHLEAIVPDKSILRRIGNVAPIFFLLRRTENAVRWPNDDLQRDDIGPPPAKNDLAGLSSPRMCLHIRDAVAKTEGGVDTPGTRRGLSAHLLSRRKQNGDGCRQEQSHSHGAGTFQIVVLTFIAAPPTKAPAAERTKP